MFNPMGRHALRPHVLSMPWTLLLAACIHGRWPETPANQLPTGDLAVHEEALFSGTPGDASQAPDHSDPAVTGESQAAAVSDRCPARTVRLVVSSRCAETCGPIDVLRGDTRLGTLLAADAKSSSPDLPEWARPPRRGAETGSPGWRRSIVVEAAHGDSLEIRGRCAARLGRDDAATPRGSDCAPRTVEVSCDR